VSDEIVTGRFDVAITRFLPPLVVWFPFVAAIVVSLGFIDHLPETVPLHWSASGQPDGEGSRLLLVALFPTLQLMHVVSRVVRRYGNRMDYSLRSGLLGGILLLLVQTVAFRMLSGSLTEMFLVTVFIGILLVIGGFFMTESKRNMVYGLRTSWTLSDASVWKHTHKVAGPVTMLTGGLCVIFGMLLPPAMAIGATLGLGLLSAGFQIYYSYLVAQAFRN
jgi:uncharacterized membrane protein